jgi:hypothetical protein
VQPLEKAQNDKRFLLSKVGVGLQKVGMDLPPAPRPIGLRPVWAPTAERLMQAKAQVYEKTGFAGNGGRFERAGASAERISNG